MNKVEQLCANNHENYEQYLRRMNNFSVTTKGNICVIAKDYHTILDVGCADGVLAELIQKFNPKAKVIGIDINAESVQKAKDRGVEAYHLSLAEIYKLGINFDCIIFSSVLHEFSSYDLVLPFSAAPIIDALICAKAVLANNGIIIIRDGLKTKWKDQSLIEIKFKNAEDEKWLDKFISEFKGFTFPLENTIYKRENGKIFCRPDVVQEFLVTWTWGAESWAREINEKYCILTEDTWKRIFNFLDFNIKYFSTSKEEYPKYLNKKVELFNYNKPWFPDITFLTILEKKS